MDTVAIKSKKLQPLFISLAIIATGSELIYRYPLLKIWRIVKNKRNHFFDTIIHCKRKANKFLGFI